MTIPILILAAGASRRMGGQDKLLMEAEGQSLLRHVAVRAIATGHPVMVALPIDDALRRAALADLDLLFVEVGNPTQGMAASLRAGLKAMPEDTTGLLVALADMPEVTAGDYLSIINAFRGDANKNIYRAATHNKAGNPVLLPRWVLRDPNVFKGDSGARHLLRQHADRIRLVTLPNEHATTDLDTPEDWAAWRNRS